MSRRDGWAARNWLAYAFVCPERTRPVSDTGLVPFEQSRLALADADAERREAVAAAAAAEFVQEGDDESRAAHPERMAERNRAPVDVHLRRIEAELADHGEALRRERLVQLDEVEIVGRDAAPLEDFADGRDRPHAHHARVDPR